MANSPEIKLEKKVDAKLDISDKQYLSWLKAEDLQKSFQKLRDEKFDLSAKSKWVKLEDIVKNYNTSTHTIEINKEKIPVGKWTDLAAWIQVLLVADWRNIKTNQSKINLWIDGSIWDTTWGAIDDYKNAVKETPVTTTENNSWIEKTLISKEKGKKILSNINDTDLKAYAKENKSYDFRFKLAIDKWIMDKDYKINSADINKDTKELVIKSNVKGSYGKEYKIPLKDFVVDAQNGTIDQNKFVSAFNEKVIKSIIVAESINNKDVKYNSYADQYNNLKTPFIWGRTSDLTLNLSTNYMDNTKANMKSLKALSDNMKKDWTIWVDARDNKYRDPRAEKLVKDIENRATTLDKRLGYLTMKKWDEAKVKWFEDFLDTKTPRTAWEKMKFDNEVAAKKWEYKQYRDDFNKRSSTYIKVSYTDRTNFDARLKWIDKTYGYK